MGLLGEYVSCQLIAGDYRLCRHDGLVQVFKSCRLCLRAEYKILLGETAMKVVDWLVDTVV